MINVNSMVDIEVFLSRNGLSLERLGTLCRFVDAGGLSRAAGGERARVSLYSRQLKELEEFFGVPLARRSGRSSVPTDAAARLAALVRVHLDALNDFAAEERRVPRRITIASSQSVFEWWVLPRVDAVRSALPRGSSIVLLDLRTDEIAEALRTHTADLGILRSDAVPAGTRVTALTDIRYRLFVQASLAHGRTARELLAELPLAVSMGGQFRRQFDTAAAHADLALDVALECSSFTLVAAAVARGYGALLPSIASAAFDPRRVSSFALPFKTEPVRKLVAAWPESDDRPWLRALRSALK